MYIIKDTLQYISTHLSRMFLMGLNMVWAFFILVLLLSLHNSLYVYCINQFKGLDNTTMFISTNPSPTLELALNMQKNFNAIKQVSPIFSTCAPIAYQDTVDTASCLGLAPCYKSICHLTIKEGRFFTERDQHTTAKLCVISERIKERLFGNKTAIGKYILLNNISLKIIGITDKSSPRLLNAEEDHIYLTDKCFQQIFPQLQNMYCIIFSLIPTANEREITKQLQTYFTRHINPKNKNENWFYVDSISHHAKRFHTFFRNLSIFAWIIGICFLVTGIVNTTNIMIVTIRNREKEIIIRKILGASYLGIITMVLVKVLIITLISGSIGYACALGTISWLNKCIIPLYNMPCLTCPSDIIFPLSGTLLISSVLSSIIPIYKALNINPIKGLTQTS